MSATKIEVSIDNGLLQRVDQVLKAHSFQNRSQIVQQALSEKMSRMDTEALMRECDKLDPATEQAMAEEGLKSDFASWPKY